MLRIYNADSERPVRLVTGSMSFLEMLWDSDVPLPANTYADALDRNALIGIKLAQIEALLAAQRELFDRAAYYGRCIQQDLNEVNQLITGDAK